MTSLSRADTLSLTFPSYLLLLPFLISPPSAYIFLFPACTIHPSLLLDFSSLILPLILAHFLSPFHHLSFCCSFFHVIFLPIDSTLYGPFSYSPRFSRFFNMSFCISDFLFFIWNICFTAIILICVNKYRDLLNLTYVILRKMQINNAKISLYMNSIEIDISFIHSTVRRSNFLLELNICCKLKRLIVDN